MVQLKSLLLNHGSSPPPPTAPPPPLILEGDLKRSDQNNCGEPEQKHKFGGEQNLRGDLRT